MMNFKKFIAMSLAVILTACGGGGGSSGGSTGGTGTGTGTGGGAVTVATVEVIASASTLLSSDSTCVSITVVAKDAANNALASQPITFSASSGVLSSATATTGSDGRATAVLTAGSDVSTRDITVTAKSGNASGSVVVGVVPAGVVVALVEVGASATALRSADTNGIIISAVVKDSSNNVLPATPVAFVSSSGVLSSVSAQTGADGRATAVLTAGADRSKRSVTVTVRTGANVGTIVIPVEGTTLSVAGATSLLAGASATFTVNLKDSSGNAISAQPIAVSSELGNTVTLAQSSTDGSGGTTFSYTASRSGVDVLSVTGGNKKKKLTLNISSINFTFTAPAASSEVLVDSAKAVTVRFVENGAGVAGKTVSFSTTRGNVVPATSQTDSSGYATTMVSSSSAGPGSVSAQLDSAIRNLPLFFVAKSASTINLQTSSAAVAPNTSTATNNQVELRATVRDLAGNAVKGVTVNFTAVKDLSGGRIKTGTAVTDENGLAIDSFISGAVSTAANGVEINATVANTTIVSTALLTVSGQALFINIAANNTIEKLNTTYKKTFSVQVNDANGAPAAGQNVTLSYYPPRYRKGKMIFDGAAEMWVPLVSTTCDNEDVDRSGQLSGSNMDTNGDKRLTPGLPGIIAPPFITTNAAGAAEFTLEYGQQYAFWVDFDLSAKVVVAGTESSTGFLFPASALASDLTTSTVSPAAAVNPFGSSASCGNKY